MQERIVAPKRGIAMCLGLFLAAVTAQAEISEQMLVAESVEVMYRTSGGESLPAHERRARTEVQLEEALAAQAEARVHVRMAFSRPASAADLVDLADRHGIRVLTVESKLPTATDGEIYTAWFGGLTQLEGTLGDQLAFFEGHFQRTWENLAERRRLTGGPVDRQRSGRLREAPSRYYVAEVVAPAEALLAFDREGSIAGLVILGEGRALEAALERSAKRPLTALSLDGRPASAQPERRVSQKMGVVAPCGGPGSAENCPPDATWLPSSRWGLGADSDFSSLVVSHLGPTVFTEGDFYTQLRWAPVVPPLRRINTAAFVDTAAVHCDPDISLPSLSAPCDRDDREAVYVPNATFESEGLVPNNFCTLPLRTGTSVDINAGCFLPTFGFTNLPSAYIDTTVADSRTPLNAAIGTVAPNNLLEGFTYETYIYFWAFGFDLVVGQKAKHVGQIGTDTFPCPFPAQFCTFAVDTTKLDEATYLPIFVF